MTYKKLLSGAGAIAALLFVVYMIMTATLRSDMRAVNEKEVENDDSELRAEVENALEEDDLAGAISANPNNEAEISGGVTEQTVPEKPVTTMPSVTTETPVAPTPVVLAPTPSGYTRAQVSTHADASSCWTIIGNSVYDLTSYVSRHPGGKSKILRICGEDGTSLFEGQHSGESRPESTLAKYLIGPYLK